MVHILYNILSYVLLCLMVINMLVIILKVNLKFFLLTL